jgi:hypothetical protein
MSKILIISSRDLFSDGGEKNLMKNKDSAFKANNWETVYLIFRGIFRRANSKLEFTVLGNYSIIQGIVSIFNINKKIKTLRPEVVVFSGLLSYPFFFLLQTRGIKTSLDYQGALEEIIEYQNKGKGIIARLLYCFFFFLEKNIYKQVDIIEIVSENCQTHLFDTYGQTKAIFSLVPCGLMETYDDNIYADYRKKWRAIYSIGDHEQAAVFAGGVSKWQCIDDVMRFFDSFNGKAFLFTSRSNIQLLKITYPNSKVEYFTLAPNDLREAMCAFDFGLLPREVDVTNFVAWPNKASEYYNARLTILLKSMDIGFYQALQEACEINSEFTCTGSMLKKNCIYEHAKLNMKFSIQSLLLKYQ